MKLTPTQFFTLSVIVLLTGAVWIWTSAFPRTALTTDQITAPQQGFQTPDFNLPAYGGGVHSLADLAGQPVVINFWASWCPPCRSEMPAMQRVYAEFQDQGLVILGINATNQDKMADAIDFAESLDLSFPIAFDTDGRASFDYQVRSLPTTFFIDRSGRIQEVIVGGPISEALLRIRAEQLLRGGP